MKTIKNCLNTINKKVILAIFSLLLIGYSQCGYGNIILYFVGGTTQEIDKKILTTETAEYLAKLLKEDKLSKIIVRDTYKFEKDTVKIIANALYGNKNLRDFYIHLGSTFIVPDEYREPQYSEKEADETIDSDSIDMLLVACLGNRFSNLVSLIIHGGSAFKLGDVEAERIAQELRSNTTLSYLDLPDNLIGDEGAERIARSLENRRTPINLNLTGNPITEKGITNFLLIIATNADMVLGGDYFGIGSYNSVFAFLTRRALATDLKMKDLQAQFSEVLVAKFFATKFIHPLYGINIYCYVQQRDNLIIKYADIINSIQSLTTPPKTAVEAMLLPKNPKYTDPSPVQLLDQFSARDIFEYLKEDKTGDNLLYKRAAWILSATDEDIRKLRLDTAQNEAVNQIREAHNIVMDILRKNYGQDSYKRVRDQLARESFTWFQSLTRGLAQATPQTSSGAPAPPASGTGTT